MRTVTPPMTNPGLDIAAVFNTCVSSVDNLALKNKLQSVASFIGTESADYAIHGAAATLYLVNPSTSVNGIVSQDEMTELYSDHLVAPKMPGRVIYNLLKKLPAHGICPYCDHRPVSALDHVLPKSRYPQLAVTPMNLVAACTDCNNLKKTYHSREPDGVWLHSYFDNIETSQWLKATVVETTPAAVVFGVQPVQAWTPELQTRVRKQFGRLKLGELFASLASRKISGLADGCRSSHTAGGLLGVQQYLGILRSGLGAAHLNNWEALTFDALTASNWYCNGGFHVP